MARLEQPSAQQWRTADDNVNKAERPQRQSRLMQASARALQPKEVVSSQLSPEVVVQNARRVAARERLAILHREVTETTSNELANELDGLIGPGHTLEQTMIGFRFGELKVAIKEARRIEGQLTDNRDERLLIAEIAQQHQANPAFLEMITTLNARKAELEGSLEVLKQASPEAHYGLHLRELLDLRSQLETGRIVETAYVAAKADEVENHLRADIPVIIHGHLGSGKTELAIHVARTRFGKEPLVISGSRDMAPNEIYGHYNLDVKKISDADILSTVGEVNRLMAEWKMQNPQIFDTTELEAAQRIISAGVLEKLTTGTISEFLLGPIYRAMQEGRPLIIDEINAIPHEILIGLNHLLTRRKGDTVRVQANGGQGVTVEEGYGVIATANYNTSDGKAYIGRQKMDSAFGSRVHQTEYDYLPQTTEGLIAEVPIAEDKEQFELLVLKMINERGEAALPKDAMEKLWDLSKAARVIQNSFSGKTVKAADHFQGNDGKKIKEFRLKHTVLSMRAMERIISFWKKEGFTRPLDDYVYSEFVSQAIDLADKAYLFQVLRHYNFFPEDGGWPADADLNYGENGVVAAFVVEKDPSKNTRIPQANKFYGPRDVIDALYGKGPERNKWPELKDEEKLTSPEVDPDMESKVTHYTELQTKFKERLKATETKINQLCPVEPAVSKEIT